MHTVDEIPGSEIYRMKINDHPAAMVFGGKRAKPDWFLRFQDVAARENRIRMWEQGQKERAAEQAKRRKARNSGHSLKVGDVLNSSWGYDQTNVDFYQIVEVPSKCFVIARQIASKTVSDDGPSTRVAPVKDAFLTQHGRGEPKRYKAGPSNSIAVRSFCNASQTSWDSSHYETGWGYGH